MDLLNLEHTYRQLSCFLSKDLKPNFDAKYLKGLLAISSIMLKGPHFELMYPLWINLPFSEDNDTVRKRLYNVFNVDQVDVDNLPETVQTAYAAATLTHTNQIPWDKLALMTLQHVQTQSTNSLERQAATLARGWICYSEANVGNFLSLQLHIIINATTRPQC